MRKLLGICLVVGAIACLSFVTVFAVHDTTPDVIANPILEVQYM